MGSQWSQFFPPRPTFSEADVGSQEGKVFLVTGGASGIGFELAKMLYRKGSRVYIAGRSEDKARQAIQTIQSAVPADEARGGALEFLHLQLDDLSTIKASVDAFKAKETKLHVLWNNAGVSQPPAGSVSKQGIELQLATNCLGPFLLTQLLLPLLEATAAAETPGSVRVVWLGSQVVELSSPPHGIIMDEVRNPPKDRTRTYTTSKTGNVFLSGELARRQKARQQSSSPGAGGETGGVVTSVSLNPGAALTNLFRHTPLLPYLAGFLMHRPALAALSELYAGLSADITPERSGCYVVPWGRIAPGGLRRDLEEAMRLEDEGGSGRAKDFWEFCEETTREFA